MAARILFLLAFLLATYTIISANDEGDALLALKQGLKDPGNFLASWDPSLVNPCTWLHVTCDSNVRAIRLDLGHLNLSGSLNPQLGSLQNLQYLELSENNLEGKIPDEIGNLANLVSLDLNDNLFAGEIPKSFGKLKSLRFLRLNNNKLRGSIPRELTGLSNLKVFDVSNNDLSGVIPTDGPFANFPPGSYANNRGLQTPGTPVSHANHSTRNSISVLFLFLISGLLMQAAVRY